MSPWDKKNHSPRSRAFLSLQLLKTLENTLESVMVAGKRSTVEIVEGEFMDLKAEAWVGRNVLSEVWLKEHWPSGKQGLLGNGRLYGMRRVF